jgi:hypothetical protein
VKSATLSANPPGEHRRSFPATGEGVSDPPAGLGDR